MENVTDIKRDLRRQMAFCKKALRVDERMARSSRITARLEAHPLFQQAKRVLLYYSLPDEVATEPLLQKWCLEKEIYLPVVVGDELELRRYNPHTMQVGAFGILEPQGEAFTAYETLDLCVIPGVGFDRDCRRLGRGKGFYDRLLPHITAPCVGIAFDFQLLEEIPTEPHDRHMEAVVTESEWIDKK